MNKFFKYITDLFFVAFLIASTGSASALSSGESPGEISQFVAVNFATGLNGMSIRTSPNGINWTAQFSGTTQPLYGVAVSNAGLFVAVGDGGMIVTSQDAVTWSPQVSGTTGILWSVTSFD